jgi:ABC-type amino acid transport substrate-binding protein
LFGTSPYHDAFGDQRVFAPSESHATISRAPQSAIHRRPSYHRGDSPNTRGARVGVRRGTTAEALVNSDGTAASVRLSESNEELYAALRAGEIDAVVDDSPIAQYFSTVGRGLHACGVVVGSDARYAIMVRKGNNELRNAIDAVIDEMESDGTLRAFADRWLPQPSALLRAKPDETQ